MREWLTSEPPSAWVERVHSGLHRLALPLLKLLSRSSSPRCAHARRVARDFKFYCLKHELTP